ncbi:LINE-1 retrotransposable element ORF1 protein [Plecturocebus cupreus]
MLRAAREKGRVTDKGKPIRLTADLSAETLQARREWGPTFNILKEKNFQPRISYPAKLSFISEGKIKFFADKQVLRDYITTRPALQELLKEALHMDGNNQYQPFQKHTKRPKCVMLPSLCPCVLIVQHSPMSENTWCLIFCSCVSLLRIMVYRFIHVPTKDMNSSFFMAALYSMVYMCHTFLVQSIINGHLGCNAAVNICVHHFYFCVCFALFLEMKSRSVTQAGVQWCDLSRNLTAIGVLIVCLVNKDRDDTASVIIHVPLDDGESSIIIPGTTSLPLS